MHSGCENSISLSLSEIQKLCTHIYLYFYYKYFRFQHVIKWIPLICQQYDSYIKNVQIIISETNLECRNN